MNVILIKSIFNYQHSRHIILLQCTAKIVETESGNLKWKIIEEGEVTYDWGEKLPYIRSWDRRVSKEQLVLVYPELAKMPKAQCFDYVKDRL
jgi:hypothetical protein